MTRKDYEAIAHAIKGADIRDGSELLGAHVAALAISRALSSDNPRFNRERFLIACGIHPVVAAAISA